MKPNLHQVDGSKSTESRLKKFLQHRRETDLKGPPPTVTESFIKNILDGKDAESSKRKVNISKVMVNPMSQAKGSKTGTTNSHGGGKRFMDKTLNEETTVMDLKMDSRPHPQIPPGNRGIWSKVSLTNVLSTHNKHNNASLNSTMSSNVKGNVVTRNITTLDDVFLSDDEKVTMNHKVIPNKVLPRHKRKIFQGIQSYPSHSLDSNETTKAAVLLRNDSTSFSTNSSTATKLHPSIYNMKTIDNHCSLVSSDTVPLHQSISVSAISTLDATNNDERILEHVSTSSRNVMYSSSLDTSHDLSMKIHKVTASKSISDSQSHVLNPNPTCNGLSLPQIENISHPRINSSTQPKIEYVSHTGINSSTQPQIEKVSHYHTNSSPRAQIEKVSHPPTNRLPQPQIEQVSHPPTNSLPQSQIENVHHPRRTVKDNYIKLNLRNRAGACRGAKNLRRHNRMKRRRIEESQYQQSKSTPNGQDPNFDDVACHRHRNTTLDTVIDPIDDYLDGTFHNLSSSNKSSSIDVAPVCPRHNLPCTLLTVKKASSGNKGRRFYVCSLPQYERCNYFQWEDDTIEAAHKAITEESIDSTRFLFRQIACHEKRWKVLTIPELRLENKKKNMKTSGDKDTLIKRLVDWAWIHLSKDAPGDTYSFRTERDSKKCSSTNASKKNDESIITSDQSESEELDGDDTDEEGSSIEELELIHADISSASGPDTNNDCFEHDAIAAMKEGDFLRYRLKEYFGFSEFRYGQDWAINRCLTNKRSLFVAPTGFGKSVCYALPASIMDGLCIVVSPLISLMEDQLRRLHPSITSTTISGNLTSAEMAVTINDLIHKRLKIVFLSPERLLSSAFRRLLRPKFNSMTNTYERELPPVSLFCIDEAHCLSQWGHNFRPSYLRLQFFVKALEPRSILALTATAGPPVIQDICQALDIQHTDAVGDEDGVLVVNSDRDNIDVSAVFVKDEIERIDLLIMMLREPQGKASQKYGNKCGCLSSGSVIIYVWRKKDTEYIAEQLRAYGDLGKVVCYHAGMTTRERALSQNLFMRGKARICVATIAFGMGLDKADVSGVVHMHLPSTPENFMQEIGRAGRSNQKAKAVAIIIPDDFVVKHSLTHSECLSRSQINIFLLILQSIIEEAKIDVIGTPENLDVSLPTRVMIEAVDCKHESIVTILSYLESERLASAQLLLTLEGLYPDKATIVLKRNKIDKVALNEPILQYVRHCGVLVDASNESQSLASNFSVTSGTAFEMGFASYGHDVYNFSIMKCTRMMGIGTEPRHIYAALRRLEKSGQIELKFDRKEEQDLHLKITSKGLAFFCGSSLDESGKTLEDLSKELWTIFSDHEINVTSKCESMYEIMCRLDAEHRQITAFDTCDSKIGDAFKSSTTRLFHKMMSDYFNGYRDVDATNPDIFSTPIKQFPFDEIGCKSQLLTDVMSLTSDPSLHKPSSSRIAVRFGAQPYQDYTSIVLTKFFHGIDTPRIAISDWISHPLWAKYREFSFASMLASVRAILCNRTHEGPLGH